MSRKALSVACLSATVAVLVGCGGAGHTPGEGPDAAVRTFLLSLQSGEFDRACGLLTAPARAAFETSARVEIGPRVPPRKLRELVRRSESCPGAAGMIVPRVRPALNRLLRELPVAHRTITSTTAALDVPGSTWILRSVGRRWLLLGINPLTIVSDNARHA